MPMVLRSGKICVPPPPTLRRRYAATSVTSAERRVQNAGLPMASPLATEPSLPEAPGQIRKDDYRRVDCGANEECRGMPEDGKTEAAYLSQVYNSCDPKDHVLWSYEGNKRAMCNDIRWISNAPAVTTSHRLVSAAFVIAFVCLLSHLVVGMPVTLGWYCSFGTPGFTQLAQWCSNFLMEDSSRAGYTNRARQCHRKRWLRGFAGAAPMIPLINQLGQQVTQSTSSAVFKVREHSLSRNVTSDWEALAGLQRNCALRARASKPAGPMARYTMPAKLQHGDIVIQIPRTMSISSLNAPTFLRDVCKIPQRTRTSFASWLWGGSASRPCSSYELLAFSIFVEKHLQRQALREALSTKTESDIQQNLLNSLPLHPYCVVKSNRKNAPFLNSKQWEAVTHLTHLNREPIDVLASNMRMMIEETRAARRGMNVKGGEDYGVGAALETIASDCDEELLDLDIKDAVSVLYSKRVAHGEKNEAILPAAVEPEAGLDTYTWHRGAYVALRDDDEGFQRIAVGDFLSGSVVPFRRGELSNIHLMHRFGITVSDNPWGSAFFFRRGTLQNAAVASPVGEGVFSGHIRPLFTILEAEAFLPTWLLKKKTIRLSESMHFHSSNPSSENLDGARSGLAARANSADSKDEQRIGKASQGEIEALEKRLREFRLVCDYRTIFTSKNFGYGAFSLNIHAPIGGVQKEQYQCVRAMLSDQSVDAAEEDGTYESLRILAAAEVEAAGFFLDTCSRQLGKLMKAAELLHPTSEPETNPSNTFSDMRRPGSTSVEGNLLFLGAESERETFQRSLEIGRMMLEAVHAENVLLQRCITYFTDVRRRASQALQAVV